MKKVTTLIVIIIFLFEITYAYVPVKCRASYVAGSLSIKLKGKGILQVGENSLIFVYKNQRHEIPYENIKQMQYSKKQKSFRLSSIKSNISEQILYRYYHEADLEPISPIYVIVILVTIGLIAAITLFLTTGKYVYLNVIFEEEGEDNWATFKIKKDYFQKILLTLSSESGKDIVEIL